MFSKLFVLATLASSVVFISGAPLGTAPTSDRNTPKPAAAGAVAGAHQAQANVHGKVPTGSAAHGKAGNAELGTPPANKAGVPLLKVFKDANFKGQSEWLYAADDKLPTQCNDLSAQYNDIISSVKYFTDPKTVMCSFYVDAGCKGKKYDARGDVADFTKVSEGQNPGPQAQHNKAQHGKATTPTANKSQGKKRAVTAAKDTGANTGSRKTGANAHASNKASTASAATLNDKFSSWKCVLA